MPMKRRKAKRKQATLTPEAFAAFEAGDEHALRRALGLPPWHASPLRDDLSGSSYGPPENLVNLTRQVALEIRIEIIAALRWPTDSNEWERR